MEYYSEYEMNNAIMEKEAELSFQKRRRASTEQNFKKLQGALSEQRYQMWKEKSDVEALNKASIGNWLKKITGKMDGMLSAEEAEYLEAKLRYEELENSVSLARETYQKAQEQVKSLEHDLKALKEMARSRFPSIHEQYSANEKKLLDLKARQREISEAISAGNHVIYAVNDALKHMKSANSWATYDLVARGGLLSHMAKYENIDKARDCMNRIGHLTDRFQAELKDVNDIFHGKLNIYDNSTRFVDYFFDNIFIDLSIKNRIKDDMVSLESLKSDVNHIILKLKNMEYSIKEEISRIRV